MKKQLFMKSLYVYKIMIIPDEKGKIVRKLFNHSTGKHTSFFRCELDGDSIVEGKEQDDFGLMFRYNKYNNYFEDVDKLEFNYIYHKLLKKFGDDTSKWISNENQFTIAYFEWF